MKSRVFEAYFPATGKAFRFLADSKELAYDHLYHSLWRDVGFMAEYAVPANSSESFASAPWPLRTSDAELKMIGWAEDEAGLNLDDVVPVY